MPLRLRPAVVAGFMAEALHVFAVLSPVAVAGSLRAILARLQAAWLDLQNVMAISRRHVCQGLFVS